MFDLRSIIPTGKYRAAMAAARTLALALCLAPVGACTLFDSDKVNIPDEPPERLYNQALYLLNTKKDYKAAAQRFEEVDRQHPYSEWSRKALLMSAFAHYENKQYPDAVSAARRYVSLHPGSADAAYAQYIIGSSYFDEMPDISRDTVGTDKAVTALEEVVRKFPDTEYATSAKKKLQIARDLMAGKEMQVGRFYQQRRDYTAAINRFKMVVTRYQTTRHVEEALMRLTESYLALGIVNEAQTAAAVLGHNFPDSEWYKRAYALVRAGGLEPEENQGSWISRAFKKVGLG
ncbi:MAG: outer membrane protein assembly factor BamD [Variibacter sp.]|nr:outer membrane protein assembly factor BamD [Variibacter sp.]